MERSACPKIFSKGQNVNILNILHVYRRRFWTVLVDNDVQMYQRQFLYVIQSGFAVRNTTRFEVI